MSDTNNLTKRDRQTVRFLQWIQNHSGWWFLICTPDDEHMDLTMMKLLVTRPAKEEFYEIIFVLLMVHRNAPFMNSVFQSMLLELVLSGWKGGAKSRTQILQDLTNLLT